MSPTTEIRICMDIGRDQHHVAIGLSTEELLEDSELFHNSSDIQSFFNRIEKYKNSTTLLLLLLWKAIMVIKTNR